MSARHLVVDLFGDPGCPFDLSSEGARLRMAWRYGDDLDVRRRMVGISRDPGDYTARGVTTEDHARGRANLAERYGMPLVTTVAPRHVATVPACRAVVAVRLHAPAREALLLRVLRVLGLSEGLLIDDPATLRRAAEETGVDGGDLLRWMADPETEAMLEDDMAAARAPGPAAMVLRERLAATPEGGLRYTCPTWVMRGRDASLEIPGHQPVRVYEVAAANLAPGLAPRRLPDEVEEVLAWAPHPLAAAEVATIMDVPLAEAERRLAPVGRRHETAGGPYWSL